ncbi:hypothetical protein BUALT_Bualt14G0061400 [Buddleja alternifolia]|uniref:Uncharacterized protein n=1 Tax=Buddleja alternifolia TaxID=168488 RepID=A0AAV6WGN7_9LAMI|nr:hypothetical protein BUALT_Bualt14G0061400 [Buddleja alternifolia]
MAYNLESLIRILEQILHPDQKRWILDHNKPQLGTLLEKASSLKHIFENSSPAIGEKLDSLEIQIRDAAYEAEDIIESHMVDQMLSKPGCESFIFSLPDLQKVIEEFDSALDKTMKITDRSQMVTSSMPRVPLTTPDPSSNNFLVGLDEDMIKLKDRLTGQQTKLEIIPIVGTGGIGKTTLTRNLYNDPLIISYFYTCAWVTISQQYDVRAILFSLLGCIIGELTDTMLQEKNTQLALTLHKSLSGKRYLIVLDDIWSTETWDDIKMLFPNNNNRSRIILTTRELDVANYVDSLRPLHEMHFLNKFESWSLLREKVFGKQSCPPALVKIGEKIANNCGGLPLAIDVIGGLLKKDNASKDFWEHVANDVSSAIAEKDDKFSEILSLSYNHLPYHLKPCFLYMGAFPEDYEIPASKLMRIWVAEGFLKSIGDKTLEEAAEGCLKALVDRNLLLVRKQKSNGNAKSYGIHDLLRDLCVRKAGKEKFLYVKNWQVHNVPENSFNGLRRVSAHPSFRIRDIYASVEFMSLARSFLCTGLISRVILSPVFFELRLLRVLDVSEMVFEKFPTEILQLVSLRYLALSCNSSLPSAISRLWNLQTLIFWSNSKKSIFIPFEIWEMPELRHVKFKKTSIIFDVIHRITLVKEKLQTLSPTNSYDLIHSNFLENIPNIKNLGIYCFDLPYSVVDLFHMHKLETLKCWSNLSPEDSTFIARLIFPPSVKKLTLKGCTIRWTVMTTVGSLPNLEVLKIRNCNFEGPDWEPIEGEFCSLKFLLLEKLKLVSWLADATHFPRLRHLVIRSCIALEEIPCCIGDISTLEIIELDESNSSLLASARQIQEEQRDYGNDGLQVRISC